MDAASCACRPSWVCRVVTRREHSSAPAFDPQHGQIWYSDGNQGFFAVQLTNGVWPFK